MVRYIRLETLGWIIMLHLSFEGPYLSYEKEEKKGRCVYVTIFEKVLIFNEQEEY